MKFFVLRKPKADSADDLLGRTDASKADGSRFGDALRCPKCGRFLTSLAWLPPYEVELESWGTRYGDVVDISDELIVSDRFLQTFQRSGLRGLASFEEVDVVKVVHRRKRPHQALPRYFKASVARSSTTIDQDASGYVWKDATKVCSECLFDTLKRYRRLVIKPDTWSGDDVFFPRGGNGPIVSERFRTAFRESGLCGVCFIPIAEDHYDFFPWETDSERRERGSTLDT